MITPDMALRLFSRGSGLVYGTTPARKVPSALTRIEYHGVENSSGVMLEIPENIILKLVKNSFKNVSEKAKNAFEDALSTAFNFLKQSEKRKITLRIMDIKKNAKNEEIIELALVNPLTGELYLRKNKTVPNFRIMLTDEKGKVKSDLPQKLVSAYKGFRKRVAQDVKFAMHANKIKKAS